MNFSENNYQALGSSIAAVMWYYVWGLGFIRRVKPFALGFIGL